MYEVEFKVELSKPEKEKLIETLHTKGFEFKGVTPQNDYYTEAKKSEHGGYDLKRFRKEAEKYIYTEKIWEIVDGQKARKENEHDISKHEFESEISKTKPVVSIIKDREWFKGKYNTEDISVTIDTVKFDHSAQHRYFVEAEIDVADKSDVQKAKDLIQDFLKDILNKKELIDSPGMFMMAFEKK